MYRVSKHYRQSFWQQASDANLTDISSMKDVKSYFAIVSEFFLMSGPIEFVQFKWLFFFTHKKKTFQSIYCVDGSGQLFCFF